jgi:uncharacterized membrane protein
LARTSNQGASAIRVRGRRQLFTRLQPIGPFPKRGETQWRHTAFFVDHTTNILPRVRKIAIADVSDALAKGFHDFKAMPSHLVFLGLIYPIVGLVLARIADDSRLMPLIFPLAAGFALIGPFAAIALYELSRRRE